MGAIVQLAEMPPCTETNAVFAYDFSRIALTEDRTVLKGRNRSESQLSTPAGAHQSPSLSSPEDTPALQDPWRQTALARFCCVLHIFLLVITLPISFAYALPRLCFHYFQTMSIVPDRPKSAQMEIAGTVETSASKIVLVTGGKMSKALHVARCLWRNGHQVVLVETAKYWCSGSRFSRSVWKFETVRCPRIDPTGYKEDLAGLVVEYGVDYFIPVSSPAASIVDAEFSGLLRSSDTPADSLFAKAGQLCAPLHFSHELCCVLDDKYSFARFISSDLGLKAPETYRMESDDEVRAFNAKALRDPRAERTFVLKNLQYDPIHRLDLFQLPCKPSALEQYLAKIRFDGNGIGPGADSWQLQEYIGHSEHCTVQEYTTLIVIRGGRVVVNTTSLSSASQLNYEHIEVPTIDAWMKEFDEGLQNSVYGRKGAATVDGICCFDFLVRTNTKTGYSQAHVIECNPRVHSQMSVFLTEREQMELGKAMLPCTRGELVRPNPLLPKDGRITFWFWNELLKLVPNNFLTQYGSDEYRSFMQRITDALVALPRRLLLEDEADFAADDWMPFFMRNHFQPLVLLFDTLIAGREWKKIDFNIGKVVE